VLVAVVVRLRRRFDGLRIALELSLAPARKIIGRLLTVSTGTPRLLALQERVEQGDAEAGEDVVALPARSRPAESM